jgi:hypothetical protein
MFNRRTMAAKAQSAVVTPKAGKRPSTSPTETHNAIPSGDIERGERARKGLSILALQKSRKPIEKRERKAQAAG